MDLIKLLAKFGYPPITKDEVIRRYWIRQRILRSTVDSFGVF